MVCSETQFKTIRISIHQTTLLSAILFNKHSIEKPHEKGCGILNGIILSKQIFEHLEFQIK